MDRKHRVLIVEDNANWQDTLTLLLESRGYATQIASNYSQALEKIQGESFDAATFHFIREPDGDFKRRGTFLDSIALFQEFSARWIPVILISGFLSDELKKKSADLGIFAYLEKGSEQFGDELSKTLQNAIANSKQRELGDSAAHEPPKDLSPEQKKRLRELTGQLLHGEVIRFE